MNASGVTLPAHVVGAWATVNGVLALVIIAYGSGPFPVLLHLGGTTLVAGFALAVLASARRRGVEVSVRLPYRSVAALATGIVGLLVALTPIYGWWIGLLIPYPLLVAIATIRSERVPEGTVSGRDAEALRRARPVPVTRPPSSEEVRQSALEIAHDRRRRRRGEAT